MYHNLVVILGQIISVSKMTLKVDMDPKRACLSIFFGTVFCLS